MTHLTKRGNCDPTWPSLVHFQAQLGPFPRWLGDGFTQTRSSSQAQMTDLQHTSSNVVLKDSACSHFSEPLLCWFVLFVLLLPLLFLILRVLEEPFSGARSQGFFDATVALHLTCSHGTTQDQRGQAGLMGKNCCFFVRISGC